MNHEQVSGSAIGGKVGRSVTWGGALIGGMFFPVFVALVCASSGWLYNRLDQH